MTDQHHPIITPPRELVQEWRSEPEYGTPGRATLLTISEQRLLQLLDRSAQWGADQELEACRMEIIDGAGLLLIEEYLERVELADDLRNARRPKPPNLREEALAKTTALLDDPGRVLLIEVREVLELNRRALEALPDD